MQSYATYLASLLLSTALVVPAWAENVAGAAESHTATQINPEQTEPEALPADVTSAATPQESATNATVDTTQTASESSTFLQALASAYNTNPQLKAARESLKATDEGVAQALSGFRPNADASFAKGRARIDTTGSWNYTDTKSRGLTIEQQVFNGGETFYGYQSAKQRVMSERAALRNVEQQVLFDAVDAYSDVYEKQSVMELSQNNVDVLKKQLDAASARFEAGELTETDVAQAKSRLAQAEADLRQAEGDLKASRATFARVIGYPADNLLPDSVLPPLPASLDEALSIAAQKNPSIIAAEHNEKASDFEINKRMGTLLPDVSLRGNMSRTNGGGIVNRLDSDSVTLNINVPLYQSGAEYSRIREAKNQYQQSKFLSIDTKNAVVEAVTRTYENYQASLAVIDSTKSAVAAAEMARDGVRQESEFGTRTLLDALDAEQESFRNRVNLVKAERSKILQAYRLLASVGDLNAEALALPVDFYDHTAHYNDIKWQPAGF